MSQKTMVPRMAWATYMNTGTDGTAVWSRVGDGFTDLSQSFKAVEYARRYVHEKTERRDVTGYAPTIAYSCDVYSGDPVIARIGEITDGECVGSDAQVEIVSVNLYEPVSGGRCRAWRRNWAVIPDTKGAGVEALVMTGHFAAVGDATAGTFSEQAGFAAG